MLRRVSGVRFVSNFMASLTRNGIPYTPSIDGGGGAVNSFGVFRRIVTVDNYCPKRSRSIGLILRGCHDSLKATANDQKARATRGFPELMRDLEVGLKGDASLDARLLSARGGPSRPVGFSDNSVPKKMAVAVDVDEVLGNFLTALNKFIADRYSSNHSVSEYHVYEFFKIWNCSRDEADFRVHEFFKTSYFKKGIHPLPGHVKMRSRTIQLSGLRGITRDYFRRFTLETTLPLTESLGPSQKYAGP
ncbi:uncharacterized protein LOC120005359 isoform X2 [Tripterygium wilfordii]|uniref:uncharacterized protein LOC120005359 isoform X2 n=1 Tax=Tripterygium wilfordii TaxID=458696 RepID=UPI0018F801EE|nr:uncharacterized protein LOC120005359 isoform X2 [Tripterygium wilfordii]